MHTFKGTNCVIHYNSDMSGDVTITTKDGKLDVFGEDLLGLSHHTLYQRR